MADKLLLTVKGAAELADVSTDTIYRWISRGVDGRKLKTINTGVTRILRSTLEDFLAAAEKAA